MCIKSIIFKQSMDWRICLSTAFYVVFYGRIFLGSSSLVAGLRFLSKSTQIYVMCNQHSYQLAVIAEIQDGLCWNLVSTTTSCCFIVSIFGHVSDLYIYHVRHWNHKAVIEASDWCHIESANLFVIESNNNNNNEWKIFFHVLEGLSFPG